MQNESDVIIIGAGVIGCAIAFDLGKMGYRTLNIDRLPSAGYGPTSSSCAIVRYHYSTRDGVAMAYENFTYWKNWADYVETPPGAPLARFINSGTLWLLPEGPHHERTLRLYDELGVPYERLDRPEIERRYPVLDTHAFWPPSRPDHPDFFRTPEKHLKGAIYTPDSGYVSDPKLTTENLAQSAESRGGKFLFGHQIVAIRRKAGRVAGVTLADGTQLDARIVINVAGPHSYQINRMADVEGDMNITTRPLRHEVHLVEAPDGLVPDKICHISDSDSGVYFRPEAGGTLLVGSEDPECDEKTWVDDPDNYNRNLTHAQWEAQMLRLARRIPSLRIPNTPRGVVDLYDCSDDWIPIYDRSLLDGYYMAVGTSGNQFKNAPVVGKLMAGLIDACENGLDHDAHPFSIQGETTGVELSARFYSRHREINRESSFSVMG
jgi:sarcosine oxidase subunit beta